MTGTCRSPGRFSRAVEDSRSGRHGSDYGASRATVGNTLDQAYNQGGRCRRTSRECWGHDITGSGGLTVNGMWTWRCSVIDCKLSVT